MKECSARPAPGLTDSELRKHLSNLGLILQNHLTQLDRETAWSTHHFEPLDALVEVKKHGRRHRSIRKLLSAIRADRLSRTFLVLGDPGSGKSVALRKLARDLIAEIPLTGKVPVYLNLKEWDPETPWTADRPPTDRQFYTFLRTSIIRSGDVYVERFLNRDAGGMSMFDYLLQHGRIFFVFDSFDEIPQVLNEDTNAAWLIDQLSDVIHNFLCGGFETRGVLASRLFRKPSAAFDTHTLLELRPFSDSQIQGCLSRASSYDDAILKHLFSLRADLIPALRNPFTAGLLARYSDLYPDTLPSTQVHLYDVYLHSRLTDSAEEIQRACRRRTSVLTHDEIITCATVMAVVLADSFGLEAPMEEFIVAIGERFPQTQPDIETVARILFHARIARIGQDSPERRFSFAHRRFTEYFVAKYLNDTREDLQLESIPGDAPRREALSLYCGIADDSTASSIAVYCWNELQFLGSSDATVSDPRYLRSIHCLRFLSSAFRARFSALEAFRDNLGELIATTVAKARNILSVKLIVEATGVVSEKYIDKTVTASLDLRNFWISETALRACRHLPEPSSRLIRSLTVYLTAFSPVELLQRRAEMLFSLSLSDGFSKLKRIYLLRLGDTFALIGGTAVALFADPAAALLTVILLLISLALSRLTELGGHSRSKEAIPEHSIGTVHRVVLSKRWQYATLIRFYCGFRGRGRRVLGFWDLFGRYRDARTSDPNWFLVCCRLLYVCWGIPVLLLTGSTLTDYVWDAPPFSVGLAWLAVLLLAPYYYFWLLFPWLRRHAIEISIFYALPMVAAWLVMAVGVSFLMRFTENFHSLFTTLIIIVQAVAAVVFVSTVATQTVAGLRMRRRDRRRLRGLRMNRVWSRGSIADRFSELETSRGRALFVRLLEEHNIRPEGSWPQGDPPNLDNDLASVHLAQLEEGWLGFRR